jgi:hypothetical protein
MFLCKDTGGMALNKSRFTGSTITNEEELECMRFLRELLMRRLEKSKAKT